MVEIRQARRGDLQAIIGLLADDALGSGPRGHRHPASRGLRHRLRGDRPAMPISCWWWPTTTARVVGCLQITFIPGLSRKGEWRGQIESVRVASGRRSAGIGRALLRMGHCRLPRPWLRHRAAHHRQEPRPRPRPSTQGSASKRATRA